MSEQSKEFELLQEAQKINESNAYFNKGMRLIGASPFIDLGYATGSFLSETHFY